MPNTVSYNSQKIIPAPFVNIQKEYIKSQDGTLVGAQYNISLIGKLVVGKGSPSGGGFWTGAGYPPNEYVVDPLANLTYKTEQLRRLFADPGKSLEIQGCAGTAPIKCYPTIKSLNFQDGNWFQTIDYTVSLDANEMFGLFPNEDASGSNSMFFKSSDGRPLFLRDANEEWNIEFNEEGESVQYPYTYRINHNVSAAGSVGYDGAGVFASGYQMAKKWVLSKVGMDYGFLYSSGGFNLPSFYTPYNYIRVEQIGELNGSYSINESWIVASGSAIEEFNISVKKSLEDASTRVTIDGSVKGLEVKNSGYSFGDLKVLIPKITNAETKFASISSGNPSTIFTRAQQYTGVGLNYNPLGITIGRNVMNGVITYAYEFDDRPYNIIPSAIMESFVIRGVNPTDVFASITVPGRAAGPVIQDLNTTTSPKFSIQIEALMPRYSGVPDTIAKALAMVNSSPRQSVQLFINNFRGALSGQYPRTFVDSDSEDWNPRTGRYSREISWTYDRSC